MKIFNLAAIAVIGLMLATAFSGCTGAEKTSGAETTTGTDATGTDTTVGNETVNESIENQTTGPIPANFHQEYSDSMTIVDGAQDSKYYPFKVENGALKMMLKFTATVTPGVNPLGDIGVWIYDSEGNEVSVEFPATGAEYTKELSAKELKRGGVGDWQVEICIQAPNIIADYVFTVDVLYQ